VKGEKWKTGPHTGEDCLEWVLLRCLILFIQFSEMTPIFDIPRIWDSNPLKIMFLKSLIETKKKKGKMKKVISKTVTIISKVPKADRITRKFHEGCCSKIQDSPKYFIWKQLAITSKLIYRLWN
jgi:hypothetical protein